MKLRDFPLLTDENVDPDVVAHLRRLGFDVLDTMQSGRQGSSDLDLLQGAADQGRIIVTHDADFGTLAVHQNHPLVGVIYLRPGHIDPSFTIATLDAVLQTDPDLRPPFVLVAKRLGNTVTMRIRHLDQPQHHGETDKTP